MVTEKDIMNMGRKIKRSNNPKTLARYQAQIDAWIAELAQDQARTQTNILALEEKIKLEEEARAAISPGINQYTMRSGAPESPDHKESKKIAVKIAEKAGVSPRTVYRVHNVKEKGASEVKELMSKGELSAKAADDFVRIVPSKEEQTKIVENGGVEAIKQTVSQKVEHALELLSEKPAWEEESTEEGKRNQEMFWNYNNWLVIRGMLDKLFCPNCGCTDLKLQCCGMSIEDAAKIAHDKTQAAIDETNAKRKVIADE